MGRNLANVTFGLTIVEKYHSPSQKIRIVTEGWVRNQAYCPSCGCGVDSYENNRPWQISRASDKASFERNIEPTVDPEVLVNYR